MRIDSSFSSASVDDHADSPESSPSSVSRRASESTDDIPLVRCPVPRRDGSGFLRRSVRTTSATERSSGHVPVSQLVDEDVIDLEDSDDEVDPPAGGDHPVGLPSFLTDDIRCCKVLPGFVVFSSLVSSSAFVDILRRRQGYRFDSIHSSHCAKCGCCSGYRRRGWY